MSTRKAVGSTSLLPVSPSPSLPSSSQSAPHPKPASHKKKSAGSGEVTRIAYPFAAIVGQEEMKLALLLNVVDPNIGGVMVMGHRGTGKSTVVRALAGALPEMTVIEGCPYNSSPDKPYPLSPPVLAGNIHAVLAPVPVVDLPLGATEDRVCGTIDLEKALSEGKKTFEPGLLARANRGFLYIDEVNLLEDHLVDVLLDVAQSGRNIVEREGISVQHPARFVLVGSGNPEEGDLRPQLLDRFGLSCAIRTIADIDLRMKIVRLRLSFERDAAAFAEKYEPENAVIREQLVRAQALLPHVKLSDELLRKIAELCVELNIDGHRGELTLSRTSLALAALEGRTEVTLADIRAAAPLCLSHRLRKDPLETSEAADKIKEAATKLLG